VLADVMMPGMDGFALCIRLRALPGAGEVPILVATALDDPGSINRAYEAGATGFTTKPLNWAIETHRLRYMLRAADTARQLRLKQHEASQAREDWEQTFNAIPDMVVVLDLDLKIVRANAAAARICGQDLESIIGRNCCKLLHGGNGPCTKCPRPGVDERHLPAAAEVQCEILGRPFEVTIAPILDERGGLTHYVHVARDLSERRMLEAELRQAQKMEAIGTLAGGVAHDFNNLLTVITGYADLLRAEKEAEQRPDEDAQAILLAARRGAGLARQLLIFSRKGAVESRRQNLNVNVTIQNLQKMLARIIPQPVSLVTHFDPDLLPVHADPSQLDQVLMNLAVNAAHAMPEGGTLTIQTHNVTLGPDYCRLHPDIAPGSYVQLSVSDTGHGMSRQTMERIYEPFFTTKNPGEGTGLGLSVAFGIVRDHNGAITCYSEVGVGTTFRIYLPALGQPEARAQALHENMPPVPGGSETILVTDDEPLLRSLVEEYFTQLGYNVLTAPDGEAALREYNAAPERPKAVILDLGMPRMSGWECLQKLRSADPAVKVLVATGFGGDGVENRVFEMGARAFMHKPFHLGEMAVKLREILDDRADPRPAVRAF
jgi:signal transduction histidine kinase/DNA-binding response OmpR family regulator